MALEYFLYTTEYNNTLIERSNNSFAPLPPNTGEIHIDYFIPNYQPLYYYRESGGTIVINSEANINTYLQGTASSPSPEDAVEQQQFTGYTATTAQDFNYFTGTTLPVNYYNKIQINSYTGTTATLIGTKQNTITGAATTITTANLTVSRALVSDASGKVGVSTVTSTQLGYVAGVTSAIQTQINAKAPTASPTFTGIPAAPTAAIGTNTTQLATTAYYIGSAANTNPLMDSTVAIGTSTRFARQDHVHASDTSRLAVSTFNTYSNTTAPNTYLNKITGGIITGDVKITNSLYVTGTSATTGQLQNAVLLGAITSDGRIVATNTPALNVSESVTDVSASTGVTEISGIYYVDTTAGNVTLTVPNADSGNDAKKMSIIKKAGANNVIVTTVGGTQNIGNQTTQTISQTDKGLSIVADNDNSKWIVTQDSRYVEGQTEGELQYWNNTNKVWEATSNDITWDNTGKTFTVGGNSTPSTFKVDANDDIVYINAANITGLLPADDLGFFAGGRGAFGNSVTIDRLRANAPGDVPRSLSLIDTNSVIRVWRFVNDANDPAVEFVWGTDDAPSSVNNNWWDMYLDGATGGTDTFAIRRRTGGSADKLLTVSSTSVSTPVNLDVTQALSVGGVATLSNTTTSTTPTTGALKVAGGVGINENLNINGITKLGNVTTDVNQQNFTVIDNTTKKLANSGTKFHVYGSEHQLVQSAAAASTTSTAFQTKATMTTATLPAGTYKITVGYLWTQTSSEDFFSSQVTVGGTAIGSEHYENVGRQSRNSSAVDGSTWIPTTRVFYQTISGVNTIALQYRQQGGSTASIKDATIELIRVS